MTIAVKLAKMITDYVQKNKKMPTLFKINKVGYNKNHMIYRLSYAITHQNKDSKGFHIESAKNPMGNKLNVKIYKSDYSDMAQRLCKYIEQNKQTPNYVTCKGKKVAIDLIIYEFSRIVIYYNNKKKLPSYCTFDSAHVRGTTTEAENKKNCTNPYTSSPHYTSSGCNKLGQCTDYGCGPHSVHQAIKKFGITNIDESTIASWAGTTTNGTGHSGLNTAIAKIASKTGVKLSVEWRNFSSFGNSRDERFKNIAKLLCRKDKAVFFHILYQNGGASYDPYAEDFGHYEMSDRINVSTGYLRILNSLGGYCGSGRCGFIQDRSFAVQDAYLKGISQPSVCIITKG